MEQIDQQKILGQLNLDESVWSMGKRRSMPIRQKLGEMNNHDLVIVLSGSLRYLDSDCVLCAGQCIEIDQGMEWVFDFIAESDTQIQIIPRDAWISHNGVLQVLSTTKHEQYLEWMQKLSKSAVKEKARAHKIASILTVFIIAIILLDLIISPLFTHWGRTQNIQLDEGKIQIMSLVIMTFSIGFVVWLIRLTNLSRVEMGLHFKGSGRALLEGVLWSLPFLAIMAFVMHGQPAHWDWNPPFLLSYLFGVFFQEFFARSVLQQGLSKLFDHPRAPLMAVLASNGIFALSHAYLSLLFVVSNTIPALQ